MNCLWPPGIIEAPTKNPKIRISTDFCIFSVSSLSMPKYHLSRAQLSRGDRT